MKKVIDNIVFVCPPDRQIISKLKDREIAVRVYDVSKIQAAVDFTDSIIKTNPSHSIWINDLNSRISDVIPERKWSKYNLCWFAKELGDKLAFLENKVKFEALNIRFFLPLKYKENIISVQFLTSLGFHTGLLFDETLDTETVELLTDLCYYNKFMRVGGGSIEPFNDIKGNYLDKSGFNQVCDFGDVYYARPSKYIHIDEKGMLYVIDIFGNETQLNLSIDQLPELEENPFYISQLSKSKDHFMKRTKCSTCSTWRVCLGKFNNTPFQEHCETFFTNILYA